MFQGKHVTLMTTFAEYNCSTKMVGRPCLKLDGQDLDHETKYNTDFQNFVTRNKKALIRAWIAWADDRNNHKMLRTGPFFPNDSGQYYPTVLLYSDGIDCMYAGGFASHFGGLLKELRDDPEYGCKVYEGPIFCNRTYADSARLSRVYQIFLPNSQEYLTESPKFLSKLKERVIGYLKNKYSSIEEKTKTEIAASLGVAA